MRRYGSAMFPGRECADSGTVQSIAQFDFRHVEPTTMLGREMDLKAYCQTPRLFRFKCLIQRGKTMCVRVVQDQANHYGIRVAFVDHAFDPPCPVFSRPMFGCLHMPFSGQRFHLKKIWATPLRTYSWSTYAGLQAMLHDTSFLQIKKQSYSNFVRSLYIKRHRRRGAERVLILV